MSRRFAFLFVSSLCVLRVGIIPSPPLPFGAFAGWRPARRALREDAADALDDGGEGLVGLGDAAEGLVGGDAEGL